MDNYVIRRKNLAKIGRVVPGIRLRTDTQTLKHTERQTDTLIAILRTVTSIKGAYQRRSMASHRRLRSCTSDRSRILPPAHNLFAPRIWIQSKRISYKQETYLYTASIVAVVLKLLLDRIACTYRAKMRHIDTDVSWSVRLFAYVCLSVCLLVTTMSPTKTNEQIDVPFGIWSQVRQEAMH